MGAVSSVVAVRANGSLRTLRTFELGCVLARPVREDDPALSRAYGAANIEARCGFVRSEAHPTARVVDHEVLTEGIEQALDRAT